MTAPRQPRRLWPLIVLALFFWFIFLPLAAYVGKALL